MHRPIADLHPLVAPPPPPIRGYPTSGKWNNPSRIVLSGICPKRGVAALIGLGVVLLTATPVRADEPYAPAAYGVTVLELGMAGVFAANFNNVWPSHGPALALNFTPMVLGAGAGIGAHYADLDARPALAVHGAGWFGIEGFLIGALIDGSDKSWGLRAGRWAWTLGAIGAIGGGVIGATAIDGNSESVAWLGAAPGGFVAGGFFLGGLLVLIGGVDGDHASGQFATGALVGLTLGLGASTFLAYRGFDDTSPSRVRPAVTGTTLTDDRSTIFSFGGAF